MPSHPLGDPVARECELMNPLLWWWNGDEIGASAAEVVDNVRNAIVVKPKVTGRLCEWGVEDRVVDDDW